MIIFFISVKYDYDFYFLLIFEVFFGVFFWVFCFINNRFLMFGWMFNLEKNLKWIKIMVVVFNDLFKLFMFLKIFKNEIKKGNLRILILFF